ncbi:MAG: hypothetical protein J6C00_01840 [Eubacterium sp.]|nr:hypothetical protein [Eubacterium sp.]
MDAQELKTYTGHICDLEGRLYAMQIVRKNLINKIRNLKNYKIEELVDEEYVEELYLGDILLTALGLGILGIFVGAAMTYIVFSDIFETISPSIVTYFGSSKMIVLIGGLIGGVLVAFFGLFDKISAHKSNVRRTMEKNILIKKQNKKAAENNKNLIATRNQQANILQFQVDDLNQMIQDTKNVLGCYYQKNIIYPKYWNWVAVASFYEYLSSGRCTSLEGHEGAYNIFENESRQDLIIRKLDEVIENLNEIKENQYMLYSEIKQQNETVSKLTNDVYNCALSLNRIEVSNEMIDYKCQCIAQNTEFLSWLQIVNMG